MDTKNIAVVVPSIRPDSLKKFKENWKDLFEKHSVTLVKVLDGEKPEVLCNDISSSVEEIMGEYSDVIYNLNDGVRNLGFAYVAKYLPDVEYIISLDDDCLTIEGSDPIQEHIDALNMRVPISWFSTTLGGDYMRGFPYGVRSEAEVVLSHGVWTNVPDLDAPTQLVKGIYEPSFYRGAIPKGSLFPLCIMNVAFKRKLLPYMYQAPAYAQYQRFSDIWSGINMKRAIDEKGWAAVTGYSTIFHDRKSNVFTNLIKEATGIGANEYYWDGNILGHEDYFHNYEIKLNRWDNFIRSAMNPQGFYKTL